MKSKALIAMAVAGAVWSAGAVAGGMGHSAHMDTGNRANWSSSVYSTFPSSASEAPESLTTQTSLDTRTGGYKGWGPIANFMGPSSANESDPDSILDKEREHRQHVAEVESARQQVWMANAPLRGEADNIGGTSNQGVGSGGYISR